MSNQKIKVKDRDFCNKLDRKQTNKKRRQEESAIVKSFTKKFIESQRDIDPDIAKVVHEHFWDML